MTGSIVSSRAAAVPAALLDAVRRLTGLPDEVAALAVEVGALRADLAQLRREAPGDGSAGIDASGAVAAPGAGSGAVVTEEAGPGADAGPAADAGLPVEPFDDGVELFAERMAVLEEGLDDVAERLEGMTRDGIAQLTAQIEKLSRRIDEIASRLTPSG